MRLYKEFLRNRGGYILGNENTTVRTGVAYHLQLMAAEMAFVATCLQ